MLKVSQNVYNERLNSIENFKQKFFRSISHDLLTPLNAMQIYVDTIKMHPDQVTQEAVVTRVGHNVLLLLNMINNLLDYSSILNAQLQPNVSRFDLTDVISDVKELIDFQANQKRLKFNIQTNFSGEQATMNSDRSKITRILLILILNSIKHSFKGYVSLKVKRVRKKNENL